MSTSEAVISMRNWSKERSISNKQTKITENGDVASLEALDDCVVAPPRADRRNPTGK